MFVVDSPDRLTQFLHHRIWMAKNCISQTPLQVGLGSPKPDMVKMRWWLQVENLRRAWWWVDLVLWVLYHQSA